MDNKKRETILNKVREFFSSNDIKADVVDKSEVEKFETVLLVDGTTEMTVEPALEPGAAAVLTSTDGTPVPAPAGEYELQDGRVVVIEEEGVVLEVRDMAEAPAEEPMADDTPDQAEKVKRIIERIETEKQYSKQIQDLKNEFAAFKTAKEDEVKFLKEENESLTASFNDLKTFTKETLETLLSEPSKEPVVKPKTNALFAKENALDKWMEKNA